VNLAVFAAFHPFDAIPTVNLTVNLVPVSGLEAQLSPLEKPS
jgi:hypothetical protein